MVKRSGTRKKCGYPDSRDAGEEALVSGLKDHIAVLEKELLSFRDKSGHEDAVGLKQALEALKASEEMYRGLVKEISDWICDVDERFVCTYSSPMVRSILGYEPEEIIGRSAIDFTAPGEADRLRMMASLDQPPGRGFDVIQCRLLRKNGGTVWVEVSGKTVVDGEGRFKCHRGLIRDITKRKLAEEALLDSEAKFRALAETSSAIIVVFQGERLVYINNAAERLIGYSKDELLKMKFWDLVHPDFREMVKDRGLARQRLDLVPESYEFPVLTRAGEARWLECKAGTFMFKGEMAVIATLFDITERKRAENILKRDQFILAKSQETAHLGNWAWNVRTDELSGSEENWRIIGVQASEKRMNMNMFMRLVHPEDRELFSRQIELLLQEGRGRSLDYRIVKPDGSMIYINSIADKVVRDQNGEIKWIYGINQDITERKMIEARLANAKAQAELYLDLMGHDINNMNMVAAGYLEMVKYAAITEDRLDPDTIRLLDNALASVYSSSSLINNVRKLQRGMSGEFKPEVYDLGELIGEACGPFQSVPDRPVNVSLTLAPGIRVQATELLKDVFINLIDNAIKHSASPACVDIRMTPEERKDRPFCIVAVEDRGPGIPDGMKEKIFNRMQRGDTKARGSGLGLYLVKSLMDSYGGRVWVEDRVPGDHTKGAKFVVMLPVVE